MPGMSDTDRGLDLLSPPRPPTRRSFLTGVLVGCGISLVLLVGAGMAAAIARTALMASGHVPDTSAIPGESLPAVTRDFLVDEGIVEPDEQVLYFYSDGFLALREDGNLFTDRRVISYWEDDGELWIEEATYPEIAEVVPLYNEGFLANSEVTIERVEGDAFTLLVSNEDDHDERFVELLIETWELAR